MKKNLFMLFPHLLCIVLTVAICIGILENEDRLNFGNEAFLGLSFLSEKETDKYLSNQIIESEDKIYDPIEKLKNTMVTTRLLFEKLENKNEILKEEANEKQKEKINIESNEVKTDEKFVKHIVSKGDTLWDLAKKYNTDVDSIVQSNNIKNPDSLRIGSSVTIVKSSKNMLHKVNSGETLWHIARSYNTTVKEIIDINSLENPDSLKIGQGIIVPMPNVKTKKAEKNVTIASSKRVSIKWPVEGRISSRFGSRWGGFHYGLDIAAPFGNRINAADTGVVMFSGWKGSYGMMVLIDHGNGIKTRYAHASKLLVRKGERVSKGQQIAEIGSTGRSTGPHLHFEVIKNGIAKDPLKYLP